MSGQKEAVAQAIASRLLSGLNGQVRSGEPLLIWPFNETVSTNTYSAVIWTAKNRQTIASSMAHAMETQLFWGEPRLDKALAEVSTLYRAADTLTVLIINDGTTPITGTRFDDKINAACRAALVSGRRAAGAVLITTLLARRGEVIGWSVEPPNPADPRALALTSYETPSKTAVSEGAITLSPPAQLEARSARADVISQVALPASPDPVVKTARNELSFPTHPDEGKAETVTKVDPELGLAKHNPLPVPEIARPEAKANLPTAPGQLTASVLEPGAPTSQALTNLSALLPEGEATESSHSPRREPAPANSIITKSEPVARPLIARSGTPESATQALRLDQGTTAAHPAVLEPKSGSGMFLLLGLVLLGSAVGLLIWIARTKRPEPGASLISRSLQGRN